MVRRYTYLGDRLTDRALVGAACIAVLRPDGKCIAGRLGTMLVLFDGESTPRVVIRRMFEETLMGWSLGWDAKWSRDIGYGVPAFCDHPECNAEIDRGLAFVCGGEPYGGEHGCGLYFCPKHLHHPSNIDAGHLCERCIMLDFSSDDEDDEPNPYVDAEGGATSAWPGEFEKKADHPRWIYHKLHDRSWSRWRGEQPAKTLADMVLLLPRGYHPPGARGRRLVCALCRRKGYEFGGRITILESHRAYLSYPVDDHVVWLEAGAAVCVHHQPIQPQPARSLEVA